MGRSDKRSRGQGRKDGRRREFVLEEEDLKPDARDGEPEERPRSKPVREERKTGVDLDSWRREFVKNYKPRGEKRPKEFDYDNPKVTTED